MSKFKSGDLLRFKDTPARRLIVAVRNNEYSIFYTHKGHVVIINCDYVDDKFDKAEYND